MTLEKSRNRTFAYAVSLSRKLKSVQGWIAEQGLDAVLDFIQVYRMEHGKAHTWSFEDNFKPKEYVKL